jgi:hypothetical protein
VSESNYDWGQGLKELARWQQQHRRVPVHVWDYGTDPALQRLPLRLMSLHGLPIKGPQDVIAQVRGQYLAVSTTLFYALTSTESHRQAQALRLMRRPVARPATFLIYDFPARARHASATSPPPTTREATQEIHPPMVPIEGSESLP